MCFFHTKRLLFLSFCVIWGAAAIQPKPRRSERDSTSLIKSNSSTPKTSMFPKILGFPQLHLHQSWMYSKILSTFKGKSKPKLHEENQAHTYDHAPFPVGSAHCCQKCGHNNENMYAREYTLKWDVKYVGSFPISNTSADHLAYRLEKFHSAQLKPVTLSVSLIGVRAMAAEELVLSHSLHRVCSVHGRKEMKEIAYIAMEPAGQTYRKQCHIFRTSDMADVEEIESVLGNAFQAAMLARQSSATPKPITTTQNTASCVMNEKRCSSSAFLSRFIGKGATINEDGKTKRKRRPVSAVFSAFQRFSSVGTLSSKRMTSYEPPMKDQIVPVIHEKSVVVMRKSTASPVPEEPTPTKEKENRLSKSSSDNSSAPSLVFDDRLGEYIYPFDESVQSHLDNVNYFVRLPSREQLARNLLSNPEGSFVVRYSESKKRCLALSVRVPTSYNSSGISHYLIVRNEQGYRIKYSAEHPKHFKTLQMLITHHSVMAEQLPCPLYFVQWSKEDWKHPVPETKPEPKEPNKRQSIMLSRLAEWDENRNTKFFTDEWNTPKRRSRIFETNRHSRFFEIDRA